MPREGHSPVCQETCKREFMAAIFAIAENIFNNHQEIRMLGWISKLWLLI